MSTFNFDPAANIHVERTDDGVTVRFGDNTLGFNQTSDGLAFTPDWNDRHFTLAFEENSVLYHLTREDTDDRTSGQGNIQPEGFIAEMYGYIRACAPLYPVDELDLELVGAVNIDAMQAYLEDHGVIPDTEGVLQVDSEKKTELVNKLEESNQARGELYQRVLDPVEFDDIEDSGKHIFAVPTVDEVFVLFLFPDSYVGVARIQDVVQYATMAGGSRIMDLLLRTVAAE